MAKIDTLIVEFMANNTQFNKGIGEIQSKLGILQKVIKGVSLTAAALFVRSRINQFVEQANAVGQLSKSIGENAEEIQAWGEAVKRSNGTAEAFQGSIKALSDSLNLIPIEGNSPLIGYLTRLNINFRNIDGSIKRPLQLLKELSVRFQGMNNAQSAAIGKKLGLDEGTIRLLQKGSATVDELLKKTRSLGVYNQKEIETAVKLKRTFQDFSQTFNLFGLRIVSFFIPVIDKLTQGLTVLVEWINKNERGVKSFVFAVSFILTGLLLPTLAKASKAMLVFVSNPWVAGIMAIGAALALLYEDYLAWKEGAESFIDWGPAIEGAKSFYNILLSIKEWWDEFKTTFAGSVISDTVSDAWQVISPLNMIKNALKGGRELIQGADNILSNMKQAGNLNIPQNALSGISPVTNNNIKNQSVQIGRIDVRADTIDASNIASTPLNAIQNNMLVNLSDGALNG